MPRRPANRVKDVKPSPIRIVSDGAPQDAIPLGLGEPTWPLPEIARRALAATPASCPYGPNAGLDALRQRIAARHRVPIDGTLITNGSQEALFSLLQAWVNPGDVVLVPDPGFVAYRTIARLAEATPVGYRLAEDDRFRLRASEIVAALEANERVAAVVINHPANPTGAGAALDELAAVAEACAQRDVLLISDEVYRELHFGTPCPSLRDAAETGVVISSLSKGFAAPGLRIGWIAGELRWLPPARVLHAFNVTAAAYPSQLAAIALLDGAEEVLAESRRQVGARYEALRAAMAEFAGRAIAPPDGGFYHWLTLPEAARSDPMAFCLKLRDEAKVVIIPGSGFGERGGGHARLSFGASPEQVREGVKRLAPYLGAT
jgi:aspartate/methionine/tyrosine aminotransferase